MIEDRFRHCWDAVSDPKIISYITNNMKTSERFDRAISALVKGYLNGTLAKGSCYACAVGNIVAGSCGFTVHHHNTKELPIPHYGWNSPEFGSVDYHWQEVFCSIGERQHIAPNNYRELAKHEIDSTGYTWQELARVERAFESATHISFVDYNEKPLEAIDADQLRGLYAVVDVLCQIEGITDTAPYKEMFAKPEAV